MKREIRKWALKNAVEHKGKANSGSVMAKLLSEKPELKKKAKEVIKEVSKVCSEVNKLSIEKQKEEFKKYKFTKKKVEKAYTLPKLPHAVKGRVVTAFPPEPSKFSHIGHAKAIIINHEYAKKYKGKFILRFEDTNPQKIEMKYYDSIIEDMEWLGTKPDKIYYMSDHFDEYHKYMKQLLKDGNAYVCTCKADVVKKNRRAKKECRCRKRAADENSKLWIKMLYEFKPGKAILRLKGSMKSNDTAMRDPSLARIIDKEHPRTRINHRVYPNYDLPAAIEDAKITHRVRSKEFEARKGVQKLIRKYLSLKNPWIYEQARFSIKESTTKGREIRELIKEKKVSGWDDPRLVTIKALRRRGILPQAIRNFVISTGLSNSESTHSIESLFTFNRKLVDKDANRYFFVAKPVKLIVENAPEIVVRAKLHPEKRRYRKLETNGEFYIDKSDADNLKKGSIVRLKDAYNIKITKKGENFYAKILEGEGKDYQKIHWVPVLSAVETSILVAQDIQKPLQKVKGFAERNTTSIKIEEIVQFERFGFAKKEARGEFIFIHN